MPRVLVLAGIALLLVCFPAGAFDQTILDRDVFLGQFFRAAEESDQVQMEELARRAEPVLYDAFMLYASRGILALRRGGEARAFLNYAAAVARAHHAATGHSGLLTLIRTYLRYTSREVSLVLEGHGLLEQGGELLAGGRHDRALERYGEALALFRSIDDLDGVSLARMNMGTAQELAGRYDLAVEQYRASLKLRLDLGDLFGAADMHESLGVMLHYDGQNEEALRYLQKALEMWTRLRVQEPRAFSLRRIGLVLEDMGKTE
jgi:tetratricopeptide (TPR) repeat protein